jgi:uncharacterized protein
VNRLADETSPYLLQHADNPVDWYPWGEEAFERARKEDRPLFVSIGYAACHWCHVMERESFESPDVAEQLNEGFVSVKVDREERPDVDALYLDAAVVLNGSAGWPLNVFVTPDGRPFWAATYLPPEPRSGLRSFKEVLGTISRVWRDQREELDKSTDKLNERLREIAAQKPVDAPVEEQLLTDAIEALTYSFDWQFGGFGRAPKFPPGPALEFMLRRDVPRMPEKTLDEMAAGGMYDIVGGGFHRYSTDQRWLVPHFEKMLYDNAQLAVVYLHGWQVIGKERYRRVVEQTLDYMLRDLALEDGGFASSQDADTDGKEGLTYTFLRSDPVPDAQLHAFEGGRFIVRGELDEATRAELFELRQSRPQPALDDKTVASWNGLALAALAECGRVLDRADWVDAARALGEFLLDPMSTEGRLHRTWRAGVAKGTGFLEDYADVANGLLELHAATGELRWLEEANRLGRLAAELFYDEENGGFFQAPSDGEQLIIRKKAFDDAPAPSGNSMLAYVLLKLSRLYGDDELEAKAVTVLKHELGGMQNAPSSFGWGLVATDFYLSKRREIAIAGGSDTELARGVLSRFEPHAVIAFGPSDDVPLLVGKTPIDGKPAAYVCERFTCRVPILNPADLALAY